MLMDFLIQKNVSVYRASKDTGIPYTTLNEIMVEKTDIKKCSADTLYRLAKYLNVSMERLYEGEVKAKSRFFLSNKGCNVFVSVGGHEYMYRGPKNLIAFKRINKVETDVIYVDTYFESSDGKIYVEEDYVDLRDILEEYGAGNFLCDEYEVVIKESGNSTKMGLIDESLLVSDNFAICHIPNSTSDVWVKAVNLTRRSNMLTYNLSRGDIISTNMSARMAKRAVEAISRNIELITDELEIRSAYA